MTVAIHRIKTSEEFDQLLKQESAIAFIYVPWSATARHSKVTVEEWVRTNPPATEVVWLDAEQYLFVQAWLEQEDPQNLFRFAGNGEVVWVANGLRFAHEFISRELRRHMQLHSNPWLTCLASQRERDADIGFQVANARDEKESPFFPVISAKIRGQT